MAGKVFFSVTMSLDGFMAPEAVPVEYVFSPEGQNDPRAQRWMTKWSELQAWLFPQRWFRENLKLGEGGEEGLDNDIARAPYERTGASVMAGRVIEFAGLDAADDGADLGLDEDIDHQTLVQDGVDDIRETAGRGAVERGLRGWDATVMKSNSGQAR